MNAAVSYMPSPGFLPPASSLHHPSYHYHQHQPSSYPAYPLQQPPTPPVQHNIRLPSINELLPEQCLHTQKRPELPKVNTWAGPATTSSHPMMSPPVSAASSPASASPVSHHHSYSYSQPGPQSQPPQPFHHLPSPPHQHASVTTNMMPPQFNHHSASTQHHHHHHMRYDSSIPTRNPAKKRRGNLPRSVTETLRNWLHDHLHHPYPSETEKNQLMQQTGLTMNQISNWFINARRRRLPAMHKNREKQRLYGQQQPGVSSPTRI